MRQKFFFVILIFVIFSAGCGSTNESSKVANLDGSSSSTSGTEAQATTIAKTPVLEIKSKMFIQQCNDIYLNPEEYAGKKIRIEGICDVRTLENGEIQYGVIRYGPGCCGNDGVAGFVFTFDEENAVFNQDDWLIVEGELMQQLHEAGYYTMIIKASSVQVAEMRGSEYVTN
jgi:uncharacterized membrane protein YcgQ (UPF0703/DUF1980 family)